MVHVSHDVQWAGLRPANPSPLAARWHYACAAGWVRWGRHEVVHLVCLVSWWRWLRRRSGHHHRLPLVKRNPLHQEILKSDTGWQSYQKTRPRGSFRGVARPAVPGTPLLPPPPFFLPPTPFGFPNGGCHGHCRMHKGNALAGSNPA